MNICSSNSQSRQQVACLATLSYWVSIKLAPSTACDKPCKFCSSVAAVCVVHESVYSMIATCMNAFCLLYDVHRILSWSFATIRCEQAVFAYLFNLVLTNISTPQLRRIYFSSVKAALPWIAHTICKDLRQCSTFRMCGTIKECKLPTKYYTKSKLCYVLQRMSALHSMHYLEQMQQW
jgi:hypothetical protein